MTHQVARLNSLLTNHLGTEPVSTLSKSSLIRKKNVLLDSADEEVLISGLLALVSRFAEIKSINCYIFFLKQMQSFGFSATLLALTIFSSPYKNKHKQEQTSERKRDICRQSQPGWPVTPTCLAARVIYIISVWFCKKSVGKNKDYTKLIASFIFIFKKGPETSAIWNSYKQTDGKKTNYDGFYWCIDFPPRKSKQNGSMKCKYTGTLHLHFPNIHKITLFLLYPCVHIIN